MKMRYDTYIYFQVIFLACGVCAGRSLAAVTCPPAAALTDTAKNIDLGKYIAAPWYTQQQVTVDYQPANTLFCVKARYMAADPSDLKKGFDVLNYANIGKVNGPPTGVSGAAGNTSFSLFAILAPTSGPSANSKLLVGPKEFVANTPAPVVAGALQAPNGNYRIVAVGPSKDEKLGYEWAIIVGGGEAPSQTTDKGCAPSEAKNEGFWLFHRQPVAPAADVELMRKTAQDIGIDISRLLPVQQEGCKYEGSEPGSDNKPPPAQIPLHPKAAALAKILNPQPASGKTSCGFLPIFGWMFGKGC